MSLQQQVITKYDSAYNELQGYRFDNAEVIETWEKLQAQLEEARKELIEFAKMNKMSVKTDNNQFNFVQPYRKYYDVKTALDLAKELGCSREVNECIEIETKINMEKLDELVDAGKIPLDIRVKAYFEEAMTPRICLAKPTKE